MQSLEKPSYSALQVKPIGEVVEETKIFVNKRKLGVEASLRVSSEKVNNLFMDGFDWGRIVTVAGMPGSGKSTLVRQWINEFISLNDQDFKVLSFQFEMLGIDELAKDVSSKLNIPLKKIYSAGAPIDSETQDKVENVLNTMKEYPLYIVDNLGTTRNIKDTILTFCQTQGLAKNKTGLVVTLDHSLLTKVEDKEDEKTKIDALFHTLVELKKYLTSIGIKVIFIVLHQLNRNIESVERITNAKLHYPNKTDLFAASSVFYSSDYVIIIHRPCLVEGLGNWYGPSRLPVFNPVNPKQPMIYLHVIKDRFGSVGIIPMLDELEFSRIVETNIE